MNSRVLEAIQTVLDKRNKEMAVGNIKQNHYYTIKNEKRNFRNKAKAQILNNQGIPFYIYEKLCDFEEIINGNIEEEVKRWRCLLLATTAFLDPDLYEECMEGIKQQYNLVLPGIDFVAEIKREYESLCIKEPERAQDFLHKAEKLYFKGNSLEAEIEKKKKATLSLGGSDLMKATSKVFKVTEHIINFRKSVDKKIVIPAAISEKELRTLLNNEGFLYKSYIELLDFYLNNFEVIENDSCLLSWAAFGLYYDSLNSIMNDYIIKKFGIELPVIDFDLARKEEFLSNSNNHPAISL